MMMEAFEYERVVQDRTGRSASATLAIDTMFKQMRADGLDVIGFGAGEPDFPTPDHIKEAGIQAIQNNDTKYTPSAGTVELRKAVCQRLKEDCGVDYERPRSLCPAAQSPASIRRCGRWWIPARGDPACPILGELHRADPDGGRRAGGGRGL